MRTIWKIKSASYLRNFTFGVEDSLASTVGLLSGIASAEVKNTTIVITGLILVLTEALSMAVGSFLSDQSVEEFKRHKDLPLAKSLPSALVMFFSYLLSGWIPIFPYVVFPKPYSLYVSIFSAVTGLMLLGVFNAMVSRVSIIKSVKRMSILGGSVAIAGVLAGKILEKYAGA